jgi:hypothetical protein
MRDLQPGEEGEVLSCSLPSNQLLLLSSVKIFGNSFLYPEAIFCMQSIMHYRLYGSSRVTSNFLGKNDDLLDSVPNATFAEAGL